MPPKPRPSTRKATRQSRKQNNAPSTRRALESPVADAADNEPGRSSTLRRSTRTRASNNADDSQAVQRGTKRKPGYIYVPIDSDEADALDPFDLPPQPKRVRTGLNSGSRSKVSDEIAPTANEIPDADEDDHDPPAAQPAVAGVTLPDTSSADNEAGLPDKEVDPSKNTATGHPRPRPRAAPSPGTATVGEAREYEPVGQSRQAMILAQSLASDRSTDHGITAPESGVATPTNGGLTTDDRASGSHPASEPEEIPDVLAQSHGEGQGAGSQPINPSSALLDDGGRDSASGDSGSSSSTLRSPQPSPPHQNTTEEMPSPLGRGLCLPQREDLHADSDDEDEDSGSDYGEQLARQRQSRINRAGHSDVDYSDQEDEAEDLRLQNDVVPESDAGGHKRRGRAKKSHSSQDKGKNKHDGGHERSTTTRPKDKGKGRADYRHETQDDVDSDNEICAEGSPGPAESRQNKSGPLPREAKEKIAKAGAEFRATLARYSAEYGKEFSEIAFTAGWSIRSARKDNMYNIYKRWYALKSDKDDDLTVPQWNAKVDAAYNELFQDLDDDDHETRAERMRPIRNELAVLDLDRQGTMKVQSATSRIRRCKEQCINMARAYYNLQDLHVGGFIIYTGSNPNARIQSTFFTGSDAMAELAKINNVSYADVLNYLEVGLSSIALQARNPAFKIPVPVFGGLSSQAQPAAQPTVSKPKTKRDLLRALVSAMFREELNRHIAEGKHVKDFPWTQWVEKAYELQLCLHNWPKKLPAPGADFKYKELSQLQLEVLLGPTRTKAALKQWESDLRAGDDSDNEDDCTDEDIVYTRHEAAPKFFKDIQIMPWTQDDKDLDSDDMGDVPLVIDRDGRALRIVRDSKAWSKETGPKSRKSRKRHAMSPITVDPVSPIRTDQPEVEESDPPIERPSKRPQEEPSRSQFTADIYPPASNSLTHNVSSSAVHGRPPTSVPVSNDWHQSPPPIAGPSRLHGTHTASPSIISSSSAQGRQPEEETNIDARLAAARARLLTAQRRQQELAKLAELHEIEQALQELGSDCY